MTRHDAADDSLREAFRALGDEPGGECGAEDLDRIWRAVAGELPAADRRALVERMATDPALAEAWRLAFEVRHPVRVDAPVAESKWSIWSWVQPAWLGAAAAIVAGIALGIVVQLDRTPTDEFRDPGGYAVASLVPADSTLPRDAFRLRWTPGPPGSRYEVRVVTEDLDVLATSTDLTVAEMVVPREALARVLPGARVLWQVEVDLPGGGRVASQTFAVRAP